MSWGLYGILIIFGLFVLLLIINPNLSCFGRTIRSPFYPLLRRKMTKKIETEDYGFHLVDEHKERGAGGKKEPAKTIDTADYGFIFEEDKERKPPEAKKEEKSEKD